MKKEFGENLRVEIYGESHSDRIGVIVKGLPKGAEFHREKLADFMARRAPGKKGGNRIDDSAATARKEPDRVVFLRGIQKAEAGKAILTGEELEACIYNTNRRSEDYDELRKVLRPGHADLGAYLKEGPEGLRPGRSTFRSSS